MSKKRSLPKTAAPVSQPRGAAPASVERVKSAPLTPVSGRTETSFWPWFLGIIGVTALVMWPVMNNEFVNWDDFPYVLENKLVNQPFSFSNLIAMLKQKVNGNWNPLPIITYNIEYQFVEFKPWLYHFNNWWLHLVCTGLVFFLVRRLGLNVMAAAVVALLFGIHPMRVESVAWVTERKDVLFGAFYLGALLLYVKQLQNPMPAIRFWILILVLFSLSLLSKIQAVSLPLSMLCIDYLLGRKLELKRVFEKIPYFALSLATGLAGVFFLKAEGSLGDEVTSFGFGQRLLIGAYSYCEYLVKWIWPYKMSPLYPYPDKLSTLFYVAPVGVLAVLGVSVWLFLTDKKPLLFGVAFFTVNIIFLLQIVGAGQGFLADRFTYMGYLGLFYIMGWSFQYFFANKPKFRPALLGVTGIYLLAFGYVSMQQVGIWKDGVTLWSHVLKYYKNANSPYNNRGETLRKRGDYDLALADYDASIKLKPNAGALNARGMIYFSRNRINDAIKDYELALKLDSAKSMQSEVLINIGGGFGSIKNFEKAKMYLDMGLAIDTVNLLGFKNRYLVHLDLGMYDLALRDVDSYIRLNPNESSSHVDRGAILNSLKRYPEALVSINKGFALSTPDQSNIALFYLTRANTHFGLNDQAAKRSDVAEAQKRGVKVPDYLLN